MGSAARRRRSPRRHAVVGRVLVAALALALVVVVLGVLGYRLNLPTAHVAVPTAAAPPDEVVRAYVAAYDARDLATVRAIDPGHGGALSRFHLLGSFSDLVIEDTRWDDRTSLEAPAGADPDHGRVYVPVTMTAHGMDGDQGFSDGPLLWGFFLERQDRSAPWLVVDQGVG